MLAAMVFVASGCGETTVNGTDVACASAAKATTVNGKPAQQIGQVRLLMPDDQTLTVPQSVDNKLYAQLPIQVTGSGASTVTVSSSSVTAGQSLRFSHVSPGPRWEDATTIATAQLNGSPDTSITATLPGYAVASSPGCYQVNVNVDGTTYGPFAVVFKQGKGDKAAIPVTNPPEAK